ncbi:MAG: hypothetical protein IPP88_01720 [Betaproteobacteria bacterium]|nr:hypothetical protein [Betaproteobacteria bacterium]
MKTNWLRRNRHLVVSFLWALASIFSGIGALNQTGPWRFGPSLALLAVGVLWFFTTRPKNPISASSE